MKMKSYLTEWKKWKSVLNEQSVEQAQAAVATERRAK